MRQKCILSFAIYMLNKYSVGEFCRTGDKFSNFNDSVKMSHRLRDFDAIDIVARFMRELQLKPGPDRGPNSDLKPNPDPDQT